MSKDFINGIIDITEKEFKQISELVYNKFGINLTDAKKELVKGRLNKLIKELGYDNFSDYYNHVINDSTYQSLLQMIDKISTNHSFFFRETDHFEYLKDTVLLEILKEKKNLRIWCAGCASGDEAYTIAIVVNEFLNENNNSYDIAILATDISITALNQAQNGIYPVERINKVPASYKIKYFMKLDNEKVQVKDNLKKYILFKRLNFQRDNFPFKGKFDIIFCRNVMIYFDLKTRLALIEKFHNVMNEESYLFIGHSESLLKETNLFKYIRPAVYKRV